MEKQRRVFQAIKSESDRTDLNIDYDTLFFIDTETGETIPMLNILGEDSELAMKKIRSSVKNKTKYSICYQESFADLARNLSGGELRVLMHLIGVMKYDNVIFGVTLRGVAKKIDAGVNTVKAGLEGLKKKNLIRQMGNGRDKMTVVNPSIVWKGNWYTKKNKIDLFTKEQNEDDN